MAKLVPPARRYHIARESRFVGAGIRISEHGYIDAADRCCLRRLTVVEYLYDLYRRYSTRLSFHQQSPVAVCYTSPPVQGAACVREGWGAGATAVSSYASEAKRKRNEIPLSINNIQYVLTVTENKIRKFGR